MTRDPLRQLAGLMSEIAKMLAHYAAYVDEMYRAAYDSIQPGPFDHLCRFCEQSKHTWPC